MGQRPADFDQYWQDTLDTLAGYPACPEIDALPLRTTDFATLYGVRLTSLGPYRVFGYLSIPAGRGPFPAIYYAPKYQSVLEIIPQGTANLQRSRYITFALAARGQRNADTPYAAMFPGLLTDGIDRATSYIFRGIVADSVRGLQFLLTRRELDPARVVVVGNDMALITTALQPGATHVVTAPQLFHDTAELAPRLGRTPWRRSTTICAPIPRGPRTCARRWPTTTSRPLRRARARRPWSWRERRAPCRMRRASGEWWRPCGAR